MSCNKCLTFKHLSWNVGSVFLHDPGYHDLAKIAMVYVLWTRNVTCNDSYLVNFCENEHNWQWKVAIE